MRLHQGFSGAYLSLVLVGGCMADAVSLGSKGHIDMRIQQDGWAPGPLPRALDLEFSWAFVSYPQGSKYM